MFTNEELKNISVLLERTTLNGKEAIAVAQLQLKISNLIKQETTSPTTGTETSEEVKEQA